MQAATWSAQILNQITNAAAKVCMVVMKRTSGLPVNPFTKSHNNFEKNTLFDQLQIKKFDHHRN